MAKKNETVCASCGSQNKDKFQYCFACGEYLKKNYFDVLEISTDAGLREIRKAYLKAAAQCHPDKTQNLSEELKKLAEAKMLQLNHIWEILKNSESRNDYVASQEKQKADEKASEIAKSGKKFLRRTVARLIDYLALGFLFSMPVRYFTEVLLQTGEMALGLPPLLLWGLLFIVIIGLGVGLTFLWIFIEAALLHKFKTTPGKWLMRLAVTGEEEAPLSYAAALQRSQQVWRQGLGYGILPLALVFTVLNYRQAQAQYDPPWDQAVGCELSYQDMPQFAVVASALILLQAGVLIYLNFQQFRIDNLPALIVSQPTEPASTPTATPATVTREPAELSPAVATTPGDISTPSVVPQQPTIIEPVAMTQPAPATAEPMTSTKPDELTQQPAETSEPASTTTVVVTQPTSPSPTAAAEPVSNTQQPTVVTTPAAATVATEPVATYGLPTIDRERAPGSAHITLQQHTECMQKYFAAMNEAKELPLGDYARVHRQATTVRDQCLGRL